MATETYFLTKTSVPTGALLMQGGAAAVEQHESLSRVLESHAGIEASALFAEPIIGSSGTAEEITVSWYSAYSGDGVRLSDLGGEARQTAERTLRSQLAAVAELLRDPDFGPLVGAALHVYSINAVWVVEGHPVLVDWAMLPAEAAGSPEARERHFRATLGQYLPLDSAPPTSQEEWKGRGYVAVAAGTAATAALAAGAATASDASDTGETSDNTAEAAGGASETADGGAAGSDGSPTASADATAGAAQAAAVAPVYTRTGRWLWIAPAVLLALLVICLLWLLWPGTLLYPGPTASASVIHTSAVLDAQRDANLVLETRIAQLRQSLEGAICTPQGQLVLPDGTTPYGWLLSSIGDQQQTRARSTAPAIPPVPRQLRVPGQADNPASLLELVEGGTALVLAIGADGTGAQGSGFFVAPNLLMTNYHVVESAIQGGRLLVASKSLGGVHAAELIASKGPLQAVGADFALLRVAGANATTFAIWSGAGSLKMQHVIAAGFPGNVLETGEAFQRLLDGDSGSVPGVIVTDGIVSTTQKFSDLTRVLIHTAQISPGNSGGPLLDACGRVVGVNTFVRNDQSSLSHLNFSLSSRQLLKFLAANGVTAKRANEPCQPIIGRIPAPRATATQSRSQ